MIAPADIDPAALLTWIEEEQQHTRVIAEAVTKKHLRQIFEDENHGREAGRRQSQLVGRYIALAEVAGRIRAGEFDRRAVRVTPNDADQTVVERARAAAEACRDRYDRAAVGILDKADLLRYLACDLKIQRYERIQLADETDNPEWRQTYMATADGIQRAILTIGEYIRVIEAGEL